MKTLLIFTSLAWFVWFAASSVASHVDDWRQNARRDLIPLRTRIDLTPRHRTIESFQGHYCGPHYVGLEFDDKALADSLYYYMGWLHQANHFIALSWTLSENSQELLHYSANEVTGSGGHTLMFGRFTATEGKRYDLEFVIDSLPSFSPKDSAYLEIGMDQAAVGVGNEFGYDILESVAKFLRKPALWITMGLSLLSTLSLGRRYLNRGHHK